VGVLVACCFAAADARASTSQVARALKPEAAQAFESAFTKVGPALELRGASLDRDHVDAEICASGACVALRLDDPEAGCDGARQGPFCATYLQPAPAAQVQDAIASALRSLRADEIWTGTSPPKNAEAKPLWPALLAMLLAPVALGLLLGVVLRRLRKRPSEGRRAAWLMGLATTATGLLVGAFQSTIGLWDAAWIGLLMGLGLVAGAFGTRRLLLGRWLGLTLATGVIFAVTEVSVRCLLPTPPAFPPPEEATVVLDADGDGERDLELRRFPWDEEACSRLFSQPVRGATAPWRPERRHILHLGDSIAFGLNLNETDRFMNRLDATYPGFWRLDGTCPGTSFDFHLLVLRRTLERVRPDLVLVHAYSGNDLEEMDRSYGCCEGRPLLCFDGERPEPSCPAPLEGRGDVGLLRWILTSAPPPWVLRVSTALSFSARWLTAAWATWASRLADTRDGSDETAWVHLEAAMRAIRDEASGAGARAAIVVLPGRDLVERTGERSRMVHAGLIQYARGLGLPVLDAEPVVQALYEARGVDATFANAWQGDIHFSAETHAVLAAWLGSELRTAGLWP